MKPFCIPYSNWRKRLRENLEEAREAGEVPYQEKNQGLDYSGLLIRDYAKKGRWHEIFQVLKENTPST